LLAYTANNADMIRTAIKESATQKRFSGKEPKLWLKAGSIAEIKNMNKRQLGLFMDDVMRNIFYNPDFEKTQQKYKVEQIPVRGSYNYERRKDNWLKKVGEI
jgi:hypothetical protein